MRAVKSFSGRPLAASFSVGIYHARWSGLQENDLTAAVPWLRSLGGRAVLAYLEVSPSTELGSAGSRATRPKHIFG